MPELMLVVSIVLIISATCSLFEAVLYSVPASHIEVLESSGHSSGRVLKGLRKQVDRPITAVLSLNTIANTGGGAFAGAIAAREFGNENVIYFSVVFTFAILLFSEVLPKTFGVVYARNLASVVSYPLQVLVLIFKPLVALTRMATKIVLKGDHEQHVSDEELLTLVGSGLRSGSLKQHEAKVIQNVLSLERRLVRDIMTPRSVVFMLAADNRTVDVAVMKDLRKHSRVPVYDIDRDDLVGLVHRQDVLSSVVNKSGEKSLESIMRPLHFVVDSLPLDKLLRTFLDRRQHLVAVIDEFGALTGIVTLEDVLEELIGREIVDEFDQITDLRTFARQRREALFQSR